MKGKNKKKGEREREREREREGERCCCCYHTHIAMFPSGLNVSRENEYAHYLSEYGFSDTRSFSL